MENIEVSRTNNIFYIKYKFIKFIISMQTAQELKDKLFILLNEDVYGK